MPKMNFTDRTIAAIKPTVTRSDFWDDSVPGFGIRVTKGGRKTWVLMYRTGLKKRRFTLGTYPSLSLANARQRALEAQYHISKGADPALQKQVDRTAETFEDLVHEYLERHAKVKKKSWAEDERILKREFVPAWGNCKARLISRREVIATLDKIVGRGSPILANKALAVLRKTFNFGIQRDILELNPCWKVAAPAKEKSRDRVLTEDEIRLFWGAIEKLDFVVGAYYKLLLLTAQRSGELGATEWVDIDLSAGWWTIPALRSKNGFTHRVPLSGTTLAIFRKLRLQSGGSRWVFPSPKGEYPIRERKRRLREIKQGAGFDFRPHDLRRTAASHMTGNGIQRLIVSKILNHVETGVTAVYDRHSYDNEKRAALEKWADQVEQLLEPKYSVADKTFSNLL